ncbi:MAG TPA: pentapeptide repeat-containing protein, partial [Caulobacteraceae bacterium]|nr:pentapeptide repeat-containing protein [Caulobacteraceae bacterium]
GAELTGANLSRVEAARADFSDAELRAANLGGGDFQRASFRDADLKAANLGRSDFSGADFRGADLEKASIAGADFSRAKGLTQSQLNEACGDRSTELPRGLTVRACKSHFVIKRVGR